MNEEYYALKEIPIFKLSSFNRLYAYLNEPKIIKKLIKYNNFVPNIIASFQDYDNLYLIIKYYQGGSLYKYKNKIMSEEQIKFISACIIQSLTYLRREKIISRDVKMNNIIMDKYKYFNLIDFSFSINYSDKNNLKKFLFISPVESSPEAKNLKIYDYSSDYYGLGQIIYYLIFKKYINQTKYNNNSEIVIDYNNIKNYSSSCIDFLNKLIIKDYKKRIGFNNINELKNHFWFKNFDWKKFENKKIKSPFKFIYKKNIHCAKFFKYISYKNLIYKKYIKLVKNYDYVNEKIIINILNSKN